MTTGHSPKSTLIRGAAWTVGTRWVIKGLGFANTVIMARLLVPADYGIVAMAMLVVGLIQAFLDFGASTALLRKGEVSKDEVDSAWTLRVIEGLIVAALLLAASPLAAMYFQEPRVEVVLWIFAACVALGSTGNIGFTLAQKEFNFSLEFRHQVICKGIGVLATLLCGYYFRDYRGLIAGVAAGYTSGMVFSYLMHPYRPRWNTRKIGEIWAVTKWLMLAGMGSFVLRKGDELIAARVGSTAEFGMYNVGADLGQTPTGEVGPAMLRAFLPVLSKMQGGVEEINSAVVKTIAAVNTITLPIGLGFAAVAAPATLLVLGPGWVGASSFVAAFALVGTLQVMLSPCNTLLVLRGYTKVQSQIVWLEFAFFLAAAAALVPSHGLIALVWSRICGNLANLLATAMATQRYCGLRATQPLKAILRPLAGALLMFLAARFMVLQFQAAAAQLVGGIAVGVVFYSAWTFITWHIAGRPDGLESTVLAFLKTRLSGSAR